MILEEANQNLKSRLSGSKKKQKQKRVGNNDDINNNDNDSNAINNVGNVDYLVLKRISKKSFQFEFTFHIKDVDNFPGKIMNFRAKMLATYR